MSPAPTPANEAARLAALANYEVLDSLPEDAYDDLLEIAASICGTPLGAVSLIDRDRQWFKSRVGIGATETPREVAFCAHAILKPAELFVVADTHRDARFADNPLVTGDPMIRFYAGAPLVTPDGYAVGTLCVMDTEPRTLSEAQSSALRGLSRQVGALLELRRAYQRLRHHLSERAWYEDRLKEQQAELEARNAALSRASLTDALTGLANRRAFDARLSEMLASGIDFHLVLVDIDHFKRINDTYGHPEGDRCIVELARALERHAGPADLVARYGGEEFAWIAVFSDDETARDALDAMRVSAHTLPLDHMISVSAGAVRRIPGESASALIARADAALYDAKRGGRDRVVIR